ncbi:DUF305 domain-containing protein [Solimonas sp. K1W22B-7]|uniref:DUF305 domain-containing protein n=1 Tax=Solimonas sp. K1W22B-7 TaxID=2303331 RepID=UPI000E332E0E|nr:DUF305 domain-containing protein [Solimonas sp. K1W22B-7]AXQ27850.1 DUF305 domain-containing protein [Solimonas sp. K1W22B-7]
MKAPVALVAALLVAVAGIAGWQGYRALKDARSALASLQPGPIDVGFAQSMILHHQQAIGMAQFMIDGRPPGLAHAIAFAQLEELGQMRGWLTLWNQPLQLAGKPSMDWMLLGNEPPGPELSRYLLDCQRSPTGMTGLATSEQLNALRQAQGRERDRQFLSLMLAHHEGGIPMARFAAVQARLPAVRQLAGRVVMEQSQEISRIQFMLQVLADADATADAAFGTATKN